MGETNIFLSIFNWVTGNWGQFALIYLQVIGIASVIVKLTPTLKDDDVLKGVIRFMGKYAALNRSGKKPAPPPAA